MEIHILGPVGLGPHRSREELKSDKMRCMLAALAVDVGRPIALDTLVELLWDEHPPEKASKSVHAYVSRLRGILRRVGGAQLSPLISQHAHTYTLDIDHLCVDWHRYGDHVSRAHRLVGAGEPEQAAAMLRSADQLWFGEALAGLPGLWPQKMRRNMAEKRRGVTASRIALELQLGRFTELVGELASLAEQHPEDETLTAHLMVAYYGCGRHSEALRVYQHSRRVLRDRHGTEPGPELVRMHRGILQRVPLSKLVPTASSHTEGSRSSSTTTDVGPVRNPHVPPQNLPCHARLIGRGDEMRRIGTLMASGHSQRIVTIEAISGMAGVGKTIVALHAADEFAASYPDGQLYVDLRGHAGTERPLSTGAALTTLLRLLHVPAENIPAEVEERAAFWRTLVARQRLVLVFDDAAGPAQVKPLLPGNSPSLTLITSRRRLQGLPGARSMVLDVLCEEEAIALFREYAGPERTADADAVADVVSLCGYLPLAIELVATRFQARPSWDLLSLRERLSEAPGRLGEIWDGHRELARAFEISYLSLTDEQRSAFRRLGLHIGTEFGPHAAAALIGRSLGETERLLEALLHHHLLNEPVAHRFRFHDLVGEYSRTLCCSEESEELRERAVQRLAAFYLQAADKADRVTYPRRIRLDIPYADDEFALPRWSGPDGAESWLTTERSNLMAVEVHARAHDATRTAALLSHVLAGFLETGCYWTSARLLHRHAADHWHHAGDPRSSCVALLDLSQVYVHTGDYLQAGAAAREALDLARANRDVPAEIEALRILGVLHWNQGQNRTALEFHRDSFGLCEQVDDRWTRARCENNIAISLLFLTEYEAALQYFHAAISGFEEANDARNLARSMNNLGDLYLHMGQHDLARQVWQDALLIAESKGSRADLATIQINLASLQADAGNLNPALELYRSALLTFRLVGDRRNECITLAGLGSALFTAGDTAEALAQYRTALELSRVIGAAHDETATLRLLGTAELSLGNLVAAAGHLEAAIAAASRLQAADEEGRATAALAEVRLQSGHVHEAHSLWERAIDILCELDESEVARIRERLAESPGQPKN